MLSLEKTHLSFDFDKFSMVVGNKFGEVCKGACKYGRTNWKDIKENIG